MFRFAIFAFSMGFAVHCLHENGTRESIGDIDNVKHERLISSPLDENTNIYNSTEHSEPRTPIQNASDNKPIQYEERNLKESAKENENLSEINNKPLLNANESNSNGSGQNREKEQIEDMHHNGKVSSSTSNQETRNLFTESKPIKEEFSGKLTEQTISSSKETETERINNTASTISGPKKEEQKEAEQEEKEVCFQKVGCFSMEKPWKSILRPVNAPFSPEKIGTILYFYSRGNIDKEKNITLYPEINMGEVKFDSSKLTAIIVHGFASSGNASWVKDMKNAYLKQVDANVILVDWGKGANLWSYLQVAGNTRMVGKQMGMFVNYLIEHYGAEPGKIHLIGHSLGAQICSYLAKDVPGIARLTALDPAQPGFEGFDKEVRLDSSDAEFVDVVHSDARPLIPTLGFGMIAPHGHVDFYMNGGFDQPGCIPPSKSELPMITNILDLAKYPVEVISKMVSCPHGRSYEYLIESFNETEKCIFWGHKADVKNVLKSVTNTVTQGLFKKFVALSSSCSKEDCIPLGFATKKSPLRGSFVVTTAARKPYCISEAGIPAETSAENFRQESFIQKIAKKAKAIG